MGYLLARGALAGTRRREVWLVNRRGGEILGTPVLRDLRELPAPPELVVVSVTPEGFAGAVEDALDAGARAIVGITAGVPATAEAEVVERIRAAGAVLLGPNCLGARLRAAPLLDGARGRAPVDTRAAAAAAAALSELAAAEPAIQELEINPLLVRPDGAVALDARVVNAD